jgi:threonyl-tRNA synthetase
MIFYCSGYRRLLARHTQPLFRPFSDLKQVPVIELPTNENVDLLKIRHSTAHVMAMAVQRLFPMAKVAIGPWIENGLVYSI